MFDIRNKFSGQSM